MNKRQIVRVISRMLSLGMKKRPIKEPEEPQKILISGYGMGIGDLIMFSGVLEGLRKGYPEAEIFFLTSPQHPTSEIVQMFGWTNFIQSVPLGRAGYTKFKEFIADQGPFDIFIAETHFPSIWLLYPMFSVPLRVGIVSGGEFHLDHDYAFNLKVPCRDVEHTYQRNLRLLDAIGLQNPSWPLKSVLEWGKNQDELTNISEHFILLHPFSTAGSTWKRWPLDRFGILSDRLSNLGINTVIISTESESAQLVDYRYKAKIVIVRSLRETVTWVHNAKLIIANDSALTHLGGLLDKPVLGLFGPTDEKLTGPVGNNVHLVTAPCPERPCFRFLGKERVNFCEKQDCMSLISIDTVEEMVRNILSAQPKLRSNNSPSPSEIEA